MSAGERFYGAERGGWLGEGDAVMQGRSGRAGGRSRE